MHERTRERWRLGLREVDCNGPGIVRVGAGKGFFYRDSQGRRIDDVEVLERVRALAVPPAWTDVWICSDPLGHIQATGIDAKGRRQYRYHEAWQSRRSREKHRRVRRFAQRLPGMRELVRRHLGLEGMPREKVLAAAVRLLEVGCFRVGGEAYAEENGSYGLATLRKDHVTVRDGAAHFDFPAKSGQRQRMVVQDPPVVDVLRSLKRRRAPSDAELLAYRADDGTWVDLRSADVNAYVQEALGGDFSAKDFRTWVGTVLAAVALAEQPTPETEVEHRRAVAEVTRQVADHLGNTPAVARSAYIDPTVVERFEAGDTLEDLEDVEDLEELEAEVLQLLRRVR